MLPGLITPAFCLAVLNTQLFDELSEASLRMHNENQTKSDFYLKSIDTASLSIVAHFLVYIIKVFLAGQSLAL